MADEVTPQLTASELAIIESLKGLKATSGDEPTNTSRTDVSTSVTKLTTASARAMLNAAKEAAGYTGGFTKADVDAFIKEFNATQAKQIERVVTITNNKTTPATTAEAKRKIYESTFKEEYPSFFKPAEFASDYIWSKINFKDEKTLGAKSLTALATARSIADSFQLLGVSDADVKIAAKQIAMGKKTVADYTVELQQIAKREYPNLADRFAKDPTLTTYDIAAPIINMLAKTWQVDAKSIGMDNQYVTQWLRPGGADGKGEQPSYHDMLMKAKNDSKYDASTEAIENARGAATSLSSMLGFGV